VVGKRLPVAATASIKRWSLSSSLRSSTTGSSAASVASRQILGDSDYAAAWDEGSRLTFHAGAELATSALQDATGRASDNAASPATT
jgi:hypothetical protein